MQEIMLAIIFILAMTTMALIKFTLHQSSLIVNLRKAVTLLDKENRKLLAPKESNEKS